MAFTGFRNDYQSAIPGKLNYQQRCSMKRFLQQQGLSLRGIGNGAICEMDIDIRCEKKSEDEYELFIHDAIDSWFGITTEDVRDALDQVPKGASLKLRIDSPGGEVFSGVAIYNLLAQSGRKVTTYVDGLAGSIASVIALAGDTVLMGQGAQFMIHKPLVGMYGNADQMRDMIEILDTIESGILDLYEQETTASRADLAKWMAKDTFMSAEQAIERGFANGYAGQPTRTITKDQAKAEVSNYWQAQIMIARAKSKM